MSEMSKKSKVFEFWNKSSCGEIYAEGNGKDIYRTHAITRYTLEPYIKDFANFDSGFELDVLEIGVGMGADHLEWARSNPRSLTGVDLTEKAILHTRARFDSEGMQHNVRVADAENLCFEDNSFDIVYSYGVLHHSPNFEAAVSEVYRVLRPGGIAKVMIYQRYSIVGMMLWFRYGFLRGRPLLSLDYIYDKYLESPGTKAYSVSEAKEIFKNFSNTSITTKLSFGDLLQGEVGQRHRGVLLTLGKLIWPRYILNRYFSHFGLLLLITAKK